MAILRVPVNSSDHVQNPDNAPVTLLEYGDYQCPYCGRAYPVVKRVQRHCGPRLRFAFRHFPLTEIHEYAEAAVETAEYAGFYGRFWEAHDMLYENHDRLGVPLFLAIVRYLGLSDTLDYPSRGFATPWHTAPSPIRCGVIS
ncbi:MAG: thioredoxin domain-containing protein [Stellaceae bacterium]